MEVHRRRLKAGERVVLLVVAESQGSVRAVQGYKMAVAADGDLRRPYRRRGDGG